MCEGAHLLQGNAPCLRQQEVHKQACQTVPHAEKQKHTCNRSRSQATTAENSQKLNHLKDKAGRVRHDQCSLHAFRCVQRPLPQVAILLGRQNDCTTRGRSAMGIGHTILHRAEHAEEGLPHSSSTSQLHKGSDALASRARVEGLDLTGHQPPQGAPPPPQGRYEHTHLPTCRGQ